MVAAGGTGGHLFPAEALSAALSKRGIATALATDNRAAKYADYFSSMHVVPSATVRGRDPISLARTGVTLAMGLGKAVLMMRRVRPSRCRPFLPHHFSRSRRCCTSRMR
jgi:UDP-N-acetylglucosamine--N-acetylmuramyl-(pentapeptide) pyrophosphoryl-undecaprenol N-acetylglucosamine transferase